MALLQIAEPGESAAPHQHKLAVGIDLGTTNSLVAALRSGLSERGLYAKKRRWCAGAQEFVHPLRSLRSSLPL